jgi:hypothetical protein
VNVLESSVGKDASSVLPYVREEHVAELNKAGHCEAGRAESHNQRYRHGGKLLNRRALLERSCGQRINGSLIGERHRDGEDLRDNKRGDGKDNPGAQVGAPFRPYEGQELPDNGFVTRFV